MTTAHRFTPGWQPIWWEPVLWKGSTFNFAVTFTSLEPGTITGGTITLGSKAFTVDVVQSGIQVAIEPHQWQGVAAGEKAQLHLHTSGGTILWLDGFVELGGFDRDRT